MDNEVKSEGAAGHKMANERNELELAKLRLELRRLQQPCWTSLREFGWREITAIFVATAGIFLGWWTGWFNVSKERLAIETANLEKRRFQLEAGNADLEKTIQRLQLDSNRLHNENRNMSDVLGKYEAERNALVFLLNYHKQAIKPGENPPPVVDISLIDDPKFFRVSIRNGHPSPLGAGNPPISDIRYDARVGILLDKLIEIPPLSSLSVIGLELRNEETERIGRLTQLKSLFLYFNNLTDKELTPLGNLIALDDLGLSNNRIRSPDALTRLPSVRMLRLNNTDLNDEGLSTLSGMSIEILLLDGAAVTDKGIAHLNRLSRLKLVSLMKNENVTGDGFQQLNNPQLKALCVEQEKNSQDVERGLRNRMPQIRVMPLPLGELDNELYNLFLK